MRRAVGLALLCFGVGQADIGYAATLRTAVAVNHARIKLSDLFSGLEAGQDVEIGDAPALGGSYLVGGAQLTAIAAQYNLDWPEASPLLSTTVTRSARLIREDDIIPVLRQALGVSDGEQADITLSGFKVVAVSSDDKGEPIVLHLEKATGESGHFSARLKIPSSHGGEDTVFDVNGSEVINVSAVVLKHSLRPGQPILPEDVETSLVSASRVPDDALQTVQDAVGLEAKTVLPAGQVLTTSRLVHPQLVQRGSPVVMSFLTANLHLTVSGTVLEAGGKGDIVHVYNAGSRMVLTGRVKGRTEVDVIPGITPLPADNRNSQARMNLPTL